MRGSDWIDRFVRSIPVIAVGAAVAGCKAGDPPGGPPGVAAPQGGTAQASPNASAPTEAKGSPFDTTTISGRQLPPPPQAFGGRA